MRVRPVNGRDLNPQGEMVLYWMVANRRPDYNFALQRAVEWANELEKPLVVMEGLRCDYRWASDRIHAFVIQGMQANRKAFEERGIDYYPYLETHKGEGKGFLRALSERAAVVVTDEFPCFFLPHMLARAGEECRVRLEAVDSNGLLPLQAAPKAYERAVDFRRFLQKELEPHLEETPVAHPKPKQKRHWPFPRELSERWPRAGVDAAAADFPIDHSVPEAPDRGGWEAGRRRLDDFLKHKLERYEDRSHPDADAASGLSPYLHFGHVSTHEVLARLGRLEEWKPYKMGKSARGSKEGTWGMSAQAEAFLDELVTWRELGYVYCHHVPDYDRYETLPEWARRTLEEHRGDPREQIYTLRHLEEGETYDSLWNAAQRQLREEGRMHNYLRMLWGKKVLQWTKDPRHALEILIELNNKYALDGRNPNSYSGIFWCLGRFDRPWPERPVFGKIRYMTSESTLRKLDLKKYLARWGAADKQGSLF